MESSGQWLEKALMNLCEKMEAGLGLDKDMISGLVSYCELAQPQDAKEYLDNIVGEEVGKRVTEEYLRRRGHSNIFNPTSDIPTSKLQTYVKPPSHESSTSGAKKSLKPNKGVTLTSNEIEPEKNSSNYAENKASSYTGNSTAINKTNQGNSRKKKAGKVVSLAEAAKGSIVFQKGKPCLCQARRHSLVSNCLSCGKIACEQEGEGPCSFCGALVLKEGSTYAGLDESVVSLPLSDAEAAAEAYAKRLVEYDRNSASRTTVIDDQSDYYEIEGNSWLSMEEKELLKKKREEIEAAEQAKRNKVVVTFDLVGRKVLLNEDEVSGLESDNRILRAPDERELNRIKPNPTAVLQPVFIDPGSREKAIKKDGRPNKDLKNGGICFEITGRVQHDSNDIKYFNMKNQLEAALEG